MHIHNYFTSNGDHLVLLIKTDNIHKEIMLLPTTVNTFKKCDRGGIETVKNDSGGQNVVFTITEINYLLISLFCDLLRPLLNLYLWDQTAGFLH